jgi:hypothetical protein
VTPPDNLVARYQGPISARFSFLGAPRYRASAAARFSPDFQTSPDFRPISYSILTRFSNIDFQISGLCCGSILTRFSNIARFSSPISHSILTRFSNITRFSLDLQTSPDSHPIFKPDFSLDSHSIFKNHPILTRFSNITRFSPDFQARFLTRFSLDFETPPDSHPIFKPDFQTSPDSHSILKHHPILTRFSNISLDSHSILTHRPMSAR